MSTVQGWPSHVGSPIVGWAVPPWDTAMLYRGVSNWGSPKTTCWSLESDYGWGWFGGLLLEKRPDVTATQISKDCKGKKAKFFFWIKDFLFIPRKLEAIGVAWRYQVQLGGKRIVPRNQIFGSFLNFGSNFWEFSHRIVVQFSGHARASCFTCSEPFRHEVKREVIARERFTSWFLWLAYIIVQGS